MMLLSRQKGLRLFGALAIGFSIFSGAAPAFAADDDAVIQMARERFKEGVQFFDQKQYDKARAAFLQAYALKKHPAVLLNLAQSEIRSGHEAEGAKHFAQYLREEKNPTPAERQAAEAGLQSAKAAIVEVNVQADTDDAEIYVDDNLEGKTPLPGPLYLMPGSHEVELRKGDRTVTERVTGTAGQSTSVSLSLRGKSKAAAAPPSAGKDEPSPSEDLEPQTGSEEREFRSPAPSREPGRKPFIEWLVSSPVGLTGLGLTALGVGGGIGFALGAQHNYQSADTVANTIEATAANDGRGAASTGICVDPERWLRDAKYPPPPAGELPDLEERAAEYRKACSQYSKNVDNGDTMKTLSIVSWVVAGAAATGTVVYYLVASPKDERASARAKNSGLRATLVPVLGPNERGIGIVGSF